MSGGGNGATRCQRGDVAERAAPDGIHQLDGDVAAVNDDRLQPPRRGHWPDVHAITAEIYSHAGTDPQREAADRLDAALEW